MKASRCLGRTVMVLFSWGILGSLGCFHIPNASAQEHPLTKAAKQETVRSVTGEVLESSRNKLSIKVVTEGEVPEVVEVPVDSESRFTPFRRPKVGERVTVRWILGGRVDVVIEEPKPVAEPAAKIVRANSPG